MENVSELDAKLNEMILAGKILEAYEEFYAEDVVMQENDTEPRVGKEVSRAYEQKFVDSVEAWKGGKLVMSGVSGDTTLAEWDFLIQFKGAPEASPMHQYSVRTWKNGKVAAEHFFYSSK